MSVLPAIAIILIGLLSSQQIGSEASECPSE